MQALVYVFIAVACVAIGVAAYFGLTFTPIEAGLAALVALAFLLVVLERGLRRRAERRLEAALDDLTRLVTSNTQASETLGRRVNALSDTDLTERLEVVEADVSVLGTVVRQVAEAVADLEAAQRNALANAPAPDAAPEKPAGPPPEPEPVIPLETLKQAIADGRLECHMRPVVTLPQRHVEGYDLIPRLRMEDGEMADPPDFMPRRSGQGVVRRIERIILDEAIRIVRRARTDGHAATLFLPLSRATLADAVSAEQIVAVLDANRAVNPLLVFVIPDRDWRALEKPELAVLRAMSDKGVGFALDNVASLRLDFGDLSGRGVASVRADAARFIDAPESLTDFHPADVAAYLRRFDVDLVVTGVASEQQILTLIEDGVGLACGPHVAEAGPARADLLAGRASAPPAQSRSGS